MPAPIVQNKYNMQVTNNADLRYRMQIAFAQALDALSNTPLGSLNDFEVTIDGVRFRFRPFDSIRIDDNLYNDCSPTLRKQAYDRLEKFMSIALARYNDQYNL
jgi:hypothetical protein